MVAIEAKLGAPEAIMTACERVLARFGYRRMTMGDVADEARLSRRTLYLHFSSKEELVAKTVDYVVAKAQDAMRAHLQSQSGIDALRGMLEERILFRVKEVGPFHHTLDELYDAVFPHRSEEFLSYYEPEILLLQEAIERGIADRSIRRQDPRAVAEVLLRATNGFLPSNLTRAEATNLEVARGRIRLFIDLLCVGLSPEEQK